MAIEPQKQIEFGDLLSVYPDVDEEDFARKLSARVEFFQLKEEGQVQKGELFPHQKIVERFFSRVTPYETLMLFWPPGRGKTRATLQIAKHFHEYPVKFNSEDNNQKILVIAKKSVIPVWPDQMKQIPEYSYDKPTADERTAKRILTIETSKYADIVAQDKFANVLESLSDEAIRAKYSRPLIIIDEVHFLRNTAESVYDENGIITDPGHAAGGKYQNKKAYIQLRRLFQLVVGSLKIVLTGTPMPDKPEELVSVTSFVLPEHKQMTISGFNNAYAKGSQALLEYMEPRLRGVISYVSEDRGTAAFIKKGRRLQVVQERVAANGQVVEEVVEYKIRIKTIVMTERQTNVYLRYKKSDDTDIQTEADINDETFYIRPRKALNNIFIHPTDPRQDTLEMEHFYESPGHKNNKEGFVDIYPPRTKTSKETEDERKRKEGNVKIKQEMKEEEERTGKKAVNRLVKAAQTRVRRFTFRFKNEYENMLVTMPDGSKKKAEPYKVLKFGDPLPLVRMEIVRMMSAKAHWIINNIYNKWLYPGEGEVAFVYHPFVNEGGGIPLGMMFEFVGFERFVGTEDTRMINSLADRPRFAYLTGNPGSTETQLRAMRTVISSPENIYGKKILVAIASEIVATGWDFANIRKFMHLGPNFKLYRQARGRTARLNSHVNFPTEDRKFVKTYLLAAAEYSGENTVDHYSWQRVEEKEVRIRLPITICKRISFDCYLNSKSGRRVLEGEVVGVGEKKKEKTQEQGKIPKCVGSTVDMHGKRLEALPLDYSTYHLHWASEEFEEIEFKIRRLFKVASSYNFDDIAQSLTEHHPHTVTWALVRILEKKELMVDRFGYTRIIRENNGIYYLDDNLSAPKHAIKPAFAAETYDDTLNQYTKELVIPAPQGFHVVTRNMDKQERVAIQSLANFKQRWNHENSEIRMQVLERALLNDDIDPEVREFVLDDLRTVWFIVDGCVFHYYDQVRVRTAGGKYNENLNRLKDGSSIRFFCRGEKEFKQADGFLLQKYITIINVRLERDKNHYLAKIEEIGLPFLPIFNRGSDNDFRVLQLHKRKVNKSGTSYDQRTDRGDSLSRYSYELLVEYCWILGIANPVPTLEAPGRDIGLRADVQNFVGLNTSVDDWPRERLEFYFGWIKTKLPAPVVIDLVDVFGDKLAFEMSKFLSPNNFSYDSMIRRYLFTFLRESDLLLIR